MGSPPGKLTCPGQVVRVKARGEQDIKMLTIDGPAKVSWDVCVCTKEVAFDVIFIKKADSTEEILMSRGPKATSGGYAQAIDQANTEDPIDFKEYLKADEGVLSGEYDASDAGEVICRFKNQNAWVRSRLCCCRAGVIS